MRVNGVELHVSRRREKMLLVHDERVKALLPEMSPPSLAEIDHARVSAMGLGQCVAETKRVGGHEDQVDVIGHKAIGQDLRAAAATVGGKQASIFGVVLITKEGTLAPISPLGDMVGQSWNDDPGEPSHCSAEPSPKKIFAEPILVDSPCPSYGIK